MLRIFPFSVSSLPNGVVMPNVVRHLSTQSMVCTMQSKVSVCLMHNAQLIGAREGVLYLKSIVIFAL